MTFGVTVDDSFMCNSVQIQSRYLNSLMIFLLKNQDLSRFQRRGVIDRDLIPNTNSEHNSLANPTTLLPLIWSIIKPEVDIIRNITDKS